MFGSDIEFIQIVRVAISSLMQGLLLSISCSLICEQKWRVKNYLFAVVLMFADIFPALILPVEIRPTIQIPLSAFIYSLYLFGAMHQKGFRLLKNVLLFFAIVLFADAISATILLPLFDRDEMQMLNKHQSPKVFVMQIVFVALGLMIVWIYSQFTHRVRRKNLLEKTALVLRPASLLACLLILFMRIMYSSRGMSFNALAERYSVEFAVLMVMLLIGSSYAYQDIKYLRQARMNSTLLQNQEIQDTMMKDTQVFRHNIANMIYGFQGALMSGDKTAYEAYYADLVERCSIINNENVTNLQRIPSEAVKTLLLNKITGANEKNIPFYLYVDRDLVFRSIKESDMCQVLGILLDNALESTQSSSAPLITLEMHNAGNEMEIAVRNTYDEDKGLPGQDDVTFLTSSTKEGHRGLGLKAVDDILKGHAVFNLYAQGRYVEASLLI